MASVSLTVAQVMLTVDTQAQQGQHPDVGGAGQTPGSRAGSSEDRTLCFDYFQFPDPQVVI